MTNNTSLFTSRKFWAAIFGLFVLLMPRIFPTFHLDVDAAAALVVVVTSYILGVAVDPGVAGWRGVVQSRKFWAALIGFAVIVLDGFNLTLPGGLTPEMLITMAVVLGGYIGGIALEKPKLYIDVKAKDVPSDLNDRLKRVTK